MTVIMIAAIGENRELGKDNQLLWHLHEDMQFFKRVTTGYYVIMGRKSFESIPPKYKPLPNRTNVIISRNPDYMYEECYTCSSIQEAVALAETHGETEIFITGGGEIYRQALAEGIVDEMYLTHVKASFPDADVFFPEWKDQEWNKEELQTLEADSQNEFPFRIVHYKKIKTELNLEEPKRS
jgi:dihydrofolate reductase